MIKLEYVDGLKFDNDLKNIFIDINSNEILLYKNAKQPFLSLGYSEIDNIKIYTETEFKTSYLKGLATCLVGGLAFGAIGFILGGVIGGTCQKELYCNEFMVKTPDGEGFLILEGNKNVVRDLYRKIACNLGR